MTPGLVVLHAHHLESLRDLVVHLMRTQPVPPLVDEVVLVQSNGMAEWLKAALAQDPPQGLGIATALDMVFPMRFLWRCYRAVLGPSAVPQQSPFDKPRLRWTLMRLLPTWQHHPGFEALRDFLGADSAHQRLGLLANELADLYDQYQQYRPDWLVAWARGDDTVVWQVGEAPTPLAPTDRWQAQLWRALDEALAEPSGGHLAAIQAQFLACLAAAPIGSLRLPPRVWVWGVSTLPAGVLDQLAALSRHVPVILAVVNPCRHYWLDTPPSQARYRHARRLNLPAELALAAWHQQVPALLSAWGGQGRAFLRHLEQYDEVEAYRARFAASGVRIDCFEEDPAPPTLLRQLQESIHDQAPPPAHPDQRQPWSRADRSLRFQSHFSALREVEALHDTLLTAMAEAEAAGHPLHPRDIAVMVPDIRVYAPLVRAVFERDAATRLPVTLLDRPARSASPLFQAIETLIQLPRVRFTAPQLWDLLSVPAVARAAQIPEAELPTLMTWLSRAGARWGLSAAHRAAFQVPAWSANTWQEAVDRLLLGYATGSPEGDDPRFAGLLPAEAGGALASAVLGPFSRWIRTLADWSVRLQRRQTPTEWVATARALWETFLVVLPEDEEAGVAADVSAALSRWQEELQDTPQAAELPPVDYPVLAWAWLGRLDEAHTQQRFLSGGIHVGTLMPMRAIPFRWVCLLGMNEGDFPRTDRPDHRDLMRRPGARRAGDRSGRDEDRYLMLEAVLSARETLLISWVGQQARTLKTQPPSLLVAQLRDVLDAGWVVDDAPHLPVSEACTEVHPLQPFSERYFLPDSPLSTYASAWRDAWAPAARGERVPLPEPASAQRELADWIRDLTQPTDLFYRERLGVRAPRAVSDAVLSEPFTLDRRDQYQLRAALMSQLPRWQSPDDLSQWLAVQRDDGRFPSGGFAAALEADLRAQWQPLWSQTAAVRQARALPARSVHLALSSQLTLTARLSGVYEDDSGCWRWQVMPKTLRQKTSWTSALFELGLTHAVWAMTQPEPLPLFVLDGEQTWRFPPWAPDAARAWLTDLAALWAEARCMALPLSLKLALAWQQSWRTSPDDLDRAWEQVATIYEGSHTAFPEVNQRPLGWLFPDTEALQQQGQLPSLAARWVDPLLAWAADV